MCDFNPNIFSIQPWRTIDLFNELATRLKQDNELPGYVTSIARFTTTYEDRIRELWEHFKQQPTQKNARLLVDALKDVSGDMWPKLMAEILGITPDQLTDEQIKLLGTELEKHQGFYEESLLPDLIKGIKGKKDSFDSFDYRVIFLYAGGLWSFGMLATVMFDGLNVRDLADIFAFVGPNDENTCIGPRGCKQHANQIYTVLQILEDDIIPGHLRCLTSCRHMLIPALSPLGD